MNLREQSNAFWTLFVREGLYDTGYGDAISNSGADRADNDLDATIACAYMKGAADTARLVSSRDYGFMSTRWQIDNLVGIAAGMLLTYWRYPESKAYDEHKLRKICDTWERELKDLLQTYKNPKKV